MLRLSTAVNDQSVSFPVNMLLWVLFLLPARIAEKSDFYWRKKFMQTNNVVVAVIGMDQPGVIACVSAVMTRLGCNIEEMTQSTLHRQFAGI